jgi:cell division protein FtsI (penicillin-binding protein 3)
VRRYAPQVVRRVISEDTARIITGFMKGVTEEGGTGEAGRAAGYTVAGKTGTAQKIQEGIRGYSSKRIGSFIGFVPADHPRLAISVIIDEPKGIPYGGKVAAPAFREIAEKALTYLNVAPEPPAPSEIAPPALRKPTLEVTAPPAERAPSSWKTLHPAASRTSMPAVTPVALGPRVPDFSGMSVREALRLAQGNGVDVDIEGSGVAVSQSVPAGTQATPGMTVKVIFAPPERS